MLTFENHLLKALVLKRQVFIHGLLEVQSWFDRGWKEVRGRIWSWSRKKPNEVVKCRLYGKQIAPFIFFTSQKKQLKKLYSTIIVSLKWSFLGRKWKMRQGRTMGSRKEDVSWDVCIQASGTVTSILPREGGFVGHPSLSRLSRPKPFGLPQDYFSSPSSLCKYHEVLGVQEPISQRCRAYIKLRYHVHRDNCSRIYRKPTPLSALGDRVPFL